MLNLLFMGHGGNRYLAENLYKDILSQISDIKLTIISEWNANPEFAGKIEYVKWGFDTWLNDYMKADVILCPQNPAQPAKSHIKVITAMALMKPVICSNHPAYNEIILDKITGYIYNQPSDFIDIVNNLRNDNYRKELAKVAYYHIVRRFHPDTLREKFANYVVSDFNLPPVAQWHPCGALSGLGRSGERANITVGVVYKPLATPYHSYGDFIKEAIQGNVEKMIHYNALSDIKEDVCDLYVFVEFNPDWYKINDKIRDKSVMWGWDSHGHFMYSHLYNLPKMFKKVFIPGKLDVDRMRMTGVDNVFWLPEGYSAVVHTPQDSGYHYGPVFIGQQDNVIRMSGGFTRAEYVKMLYNRYGDMFMAARGYFGKSYRDLMVSRVACLDFPIANNIGTRMFESTAMGVPVVRERNDCEEFKMFFKDGFNVFEFESGNIPEMFDKIDLIIGMSKEEHSVLRKRLIQSMRWQSYHSRFKHILGEMGYA